jgi:hypothetical protein
MSDIDDLMTGTGGPAIDFDGVGSVIEGTLNSVAPEWKKIDTNFGIKEKKPFNLTIDGEDRTLWVTKGTRLATVIGSAFKEAGLTSLACGGVLKIRRVADVPTKRLPMHDYQAKYTPAAGVAITDLEEDF